MEKNIHQDEKDTSVNEEITNEEITSEEPSSQDDNVIDMNSRLEQEKIKEELEKEKDKYQRLQAEYSNCFFFYICSSYIV